MNTLTKKRRLFVDHYTDRLSPQTYQNATQSALKAGYSRKHANRIGYNLLKMSIISGQIAQKEKIEANKYNHSKDSAIIEARQNYEQSTKHNEKKYWYDMWIKLQGWEVNKQEITSTVEYSEAQQDMISDYIRDLGDN